MPRCRYHELFLVMMRKGLTLVELVVVVMILGILAAVAAPKLFKTSGNAADNGARQSLTVVRDAIDLYAAENGGALPGADATEATFKSDLLPYLRAFPTCPVGPALNDEVQVTNGAGPLSGGTNPPKSWKYSAVTGEFIINYNGPTAVDPAVKYDEL